jgi:hypothetical protein
VHRHFSAVSRYDLMGIGQPQAGAAILGGKKGIENA